MQLHFQLGGDVASHDSLNTSQRLCAELRVIKSASQRDYRPFCFISCGIHGWFCFANATNDGMTPDTQTAVAEHAHKEELSLGELKFSGQANLIRWILSLARTWSAIKAADPSGPAPDKSSVCACCD